MSALCNGNVDFACINHIEASVVDYFVAFTDLLRRVESLEVKVSSVCDHFPVQLLLRLYICHLSFKVTNLALTQTYNTFESLRWCEITEEVAKAQMDLIKK